MTNLEAARRRAGMTQRRVAEIIGCDHSALSGWEHGNHRPSGIRARKLETLFGMPVADLLKNEDHDSRSAAVVS